MKSPSPNTQTLKKLWYSYQKELVLSSKSWYFFIELGMALIILLILLFVIPENFNTQGDEYFYLDLPEPIREVVIQKGLETDLDGVAQADTLKVKDETFEVLILETKDKRLHYMPSEAALKSLVDKLSKPGIVISPSIDGKGLKYTYHLQGYESERLKNLLLMLHSTSVDTGTLQPEMKAQEVVQLNPDLIKLSDRANFLPVFLTLNGSFMSLFIIAAYIFLDRQEGIIKAYAVSASSVSNYLLSKSAVVVTTSLATSFITLFPLMAFKINYGLFALLLIPAAFFAAFVGLIITSYFRNITQSFGVLFAVIVLMMLPALSYMLPSWEPSWIKLIPTYYLVNSFKEILFGIGHEDLTLVFSTAFGLALGCLPLYGFAKWRFNKTLTL